MNWEEERRYFVNPGARQERACKNLFERDLYFSARETCRLFGISRQRFYYYREKLKDLPGYSRKKIFAMRRGERAHHYIEHYGLWMVMTMAAFIKTDEARRFLEKCWRDWRGLRMQRFGMRALRVCVCSEDILGAIASSGRRG